MNTENCHGATWVWDTGCIVGTAWFHCEWLDCSPSPSQPCYCTPGGGGCFLAGTQIELADGSTKPIQDVELGDQLFGFDELAGTVKPEDVVFVHPPRVVAEGYFVLNGRIRVTATQPVLTGRGWLETRELKLGDMLTDAHGRPVPVFAIRKVTGNVTVYNLHVSLGTYVADGIVVHNKGLPIGIYSPDEGGGP